MRAKHLYQWFPPIVEHPIKEIRIKPMLDEFQRDMLTQELGISMFGDQYNTYGNGNPELPSRLAGQLGSEVKKYENAIMEEIVLQLQMEDEEEKKREG